MTAPNTVRPRLLPESLQNRPAWMRRDQVLVAALVLLAVALRAPNLGRAYWIDEGISVGISSHPLSRLPSLLRRDGSPPLFYVILHFWIRMFGSSQIATHTLPLLVSLATIPVAYWAGRELFDRRAGLAAAGLMATNPFLNWYATETRMYTLVILLSLVGLTLAWRGAREWRLADATGAVICFTALLYTHNWALYLAAATASVLLWRAWAARDRRLAVGVVAAGAVTLALWLPWVPSLLYQARNTAAPWAVRPAIGDFFADPASALGGTLGIVVVPLLAFGAWRTRSQAPAGRGWSAGPLAAVALAATVLGFLGAMLEPSWTVRYLSVIIAPYLLGAAGFLSSTVTGRRVLWAATSLLAAWALIGMLLPNPNGRYAKDNMGALASAVGPHLHPGDVVVVTQTEQTAVAYHYLPAGLQYVTPTGPAADPGVVDWRDLVRRLEQATPCSAVGPTLDAAPVGTMVLEIDPVRRLGASGTVWSRTVHQQVTAVDSFLAHDPALKPLGAYTPALSPRPYAPVDGVLYQKTSAIPSCR